jgi:hypothetical protein
VSDIVAELVRVRDAFDKPTLRLLDRKCGLRGADGPGDWSAPGSATGMDGPLWSAVQSGPEASTRGPWGSRTGVSRVSSR